VLDYGGQKSQQSLTVALDPRIHATPEDLKARLDLDLKIHTDLDSLDKKINRAVAARDKLKQAVSSHGVTDPQTAKAVAALDRDVDAVVQMATRGSEGDLLYGTKLRDHLAYLAADIDLSYGRPTAAQEAVFGQLDQEAKQGEQRLEADLSQADRVAPQTPGHS
jgi:hypothetical protein